MIGLNVAIVGSEGYIAQFLLKRLQTEKSVESVLKIDKSDNADVYLDLEHSEKFDYMCLDQIDYIIFTAAISGPDACANQYDLCWAINVMGTQHFIKESISRNCRVLFFSSDAVFGDIPGCIYLEDSKTDAKTPYGIMKKTIEDTFKKCKSFKAIRLSYVVSAKDKFVSYCLQCIEAGITAEVFHPFYRNCITVSDVVEIAVWIGLHWEEYGPWVLNVAGCELVSRVRIADEINRIFNNRLKYVITSPKPDFIKNRPCITQMGSLYLDKYSILNNVSFSEKFKKEMEEREL